MIKIKDEDMTKKQLKYERIMKEIDTIFHKEDLTYFEIDGILKSVEQHYVYLKFKLFKEDEK